MICSSCGHPLNEPIGIILDEESGVATLNGKSIALPPRQFKTLSVLNHFRPNFVPYSILRLVLGQVRPTLLAMNTLQLRMRFLRQSLKTSDYIIVTKRSVGVALKERIIHNENHSPY